MVGDSRVMLPWPLVKYRVGEVADPGGGASGVPGVDLVPGLSGVVSPTRIRSRAMRRPPGAVEALRLRRERRGEKAHVINEPQTQRILSLAVAAVGSAHLVTSLVVAVKQHLSCHDGGGCG